MPFSLPLLAAAVLFFCGSALAVLHALEIGSPWLARGAALGMLVSAALFAAAGLRAARRVDWHRVRVEQRLWESGPLGRQWLRIRQRLDRLWKL
jgi:hypothetical protein